MILRVIGKEYNFETVYTDDITYIISREEFLKIHNSLDKHNLCLISISEPLGVDKYNDTELSDEIVKDFKASLRVKFWDIEEDIGNYKVISDRQAKQIQDFIIENKDSKFIIHCKAGQSRSAGVGKAVECIKNFGTGDQAKYYYQTGFNSDIDNCKRYSPNLTVFDKIVKDYEKDQE